MLCKKSDNTKERGLLQYQPKQFLMLYFIPQIQLPINDCEKKVVTENYSTKDTGT
jgi:hypothetical protein